MLFWPQPDHGVLLLQARGAGHELADEDAVQLRRVQVLEDA